MIIPALDFIDGHVVRLFQGDYEKKKEYKGKLSVFMKKYKKQGAEFLHLVDLNGSLDPQNKQIDFLDEILNISDFFIQIGGGIRNEKDIDFFFSKKVKRVVISSLAISKKEIVKNWLKKYGSERIVLALDVHIQNNNNYVMINGWKVNSYKTIENIIDFFLPYGLKHVICTDILRDGTLMGPNYLLYNKLVKSFPTIHFQASGGIMSLSNIFFLKKVGVKSIIIGKALLEEKFSLKEAMKCWQKG